MFLGTLLLQIGEVGQKIDKLKVDTDGDKNVDKPSIGEPENNNDREWKITFEQFLASILTETVLVEQLSTKVEIEEALKDFCVGETKRMNSVETSSRSVFYV